MNVEIKPWHCLQQSCQICSSIDLPKWKLKWKYKTSISTHPNLQDCTKTIPLPSCPPLPYLSLHLAPFLSHLASFLLSANAASSSYYKFELNPCYCPLVVQQTYDISKQPRTCSSLDCVITQNSIMQLLFWWGVSQFFSSSHVARNDEIRQQYNSTIISWFLSWGRK